MKHSHIRGIGLLIVAAALAAAPAAYADVLVWTNANGTGLASDAANWSVQGSGVNRLPTASDSILLDATSTADMVWDAGGTGLTQTVADWTQAADYVGTVTFDITYNNANSNGFNLFSVTSNVDLQNGSWTHVLNGKGYNQSNRDVYRLRVDVGGSMTVAANAALDATNKGYKAGTPSFNGGASHGGKGNTQYGPYGSILNPTAHGMGGSSSGGSADPGEPGGGAIYLTVGGLLSVDGAINASSIDPTGGSYLRAAAGGSVYIETGTIAGSGLIAADGERTGGGSNTNDGAGGRLAIKLQDAGADFTSLDLDQVHASIVSSKGSASTGTVYLQAGDEAEGFGELRIDNLGNNGNSNDWGTTLTSEDLANTRVLLRRKGRLDLDTTRDLYSITLVDDTPTLILSNASTTTVQALSINGVSYGGGVYDSAMLGDQVSGNGYIEVVPEPGTLALLGLGGMGVLIRRRRA